MTFIIPIPILGCYYKWHTHNILRNSGQLIYMKGVKQIWIFRTNYGTRTRTRNSNIYILSISLLLLISSTVHSISSTVFHLLISEFHTTEVSELFDTKPRVPSICVQNQSITKTESSYWYLKVSRVWYPSVRTYVRFDHHISQPRSIHQINTIDNNHETIINTSLLFLFFLVVE